MARYFTVGPYVMEVLSKRQAAAIYPRADWDDCYPLLPDLHVPEHGPIDTGILDNRGDAIMRAPNPMGFGRDNEW